MLVVTGIIEIDPADRDAAKIAAAKMAEATRDEDGCITYAFYEDVEVPGRFRVYEEWESMAALAAHAQTPHMGEFRAALAGMKILSSAIKKIEGGTESPLG